MLVLTLMRATSGMPVRRLLLEMAENAGMWKQQELPWCSDESGSLHLCLNLGGIGCKQQHRKEFEV